MMRSRGGWLLWVVLAGCVLSWTCMTGCEDSDDDGGSDAETNAAPAEAGVAAPDKSGETPESPEIVGIWQGVAGSPAEPVKMSLELEQEGSECGQSSNSKHFDAVLAWSSGDVWRASDYDTMKCGDTLMLVFRTPYSPAEPLTERTDTWTLQWDGGDNMAGLADVSVMVFNENAEIVSVTTSTYRVSLRR